MTETVTPLSETVSQIVRSRTCGCRDFYIAKITWKLGRLAASSSRALHFH